MKITAHAKQRIAEMAIDLDEVMAVVHDPEVRAPSTIVPGRFMLSGGRIAVITEPREAPKADRLVTVMWWSPDRYRTRAEGNPT